MPISQKTVLIIYGLLAELAEASEKTLGRLTQPDLLEERPTGLPDALEGIRGLNLRAQKAQREAIAAIMGDDAGISVNPITGKLE